MPTTQSRAKMIAPIAAVSPAAASSAARTGMTVADSRVSVIVPAPRLGVRWTPGGAPRGWMIEGDDGHILDNVERLLPRKQTFGYSALMPPNRPPRPRAAPTPSPAGEYLECPPIASSSGAPPRTT